MKMRELSRKSMWKTLPGEMGTPYFVLPFDPYKERDHNFVCDIVMVEKYGLWKTLFYRMFGREHARVFLDPIPESETDQVMVRKYIRDNIENLPPDKRSKVTIIEHQKGA